MSPKELWEKKPVKYAVTVAGLILLYIVGSQIIAWVG